MRTDSENQSFLSKNRNSATSSVISNGFNFFFRNAASSSFSSKPNTPFRCELVDGRAGVITSVRTIAGLASEDDITEGDAALTIGEFATGVPSDATKKL